MSETEENSKKDASPNEEPSIDKFFQVCATGSPTSVEEFLESNPGIDINAGNETGDTAVHWAAASGLWDVVKLLHEKGANLSIKNHIGNTPLHCAAGNGYLAIVKFLKDQEVDLNAQNESLETPLHCATRNGHVEVVECLRLYGADVDVQDERGRTPLHVACQRRQSPIALMLLHLGCDQTLKDKMKETALHVACREELLSVVQIMCGYGCPVDEENKIGLSPLHIAAKTGNSDVVRCLLLAGVDLEKCIEDDVKAEDIAIAQGHTDVAELLSRLSSTLTQDRRDPLVKQLMPSTQHLDRIKLLVFGNSGVGKTSLIESFKCGYFRSFFRRVYSQPEPFPGFVNGNSSDKYSGLLHPMPQHARYTRGIDVQQVNITDAGAVSMWEFSGYEPYYAVYDHFIGEPTVINIIVVNASDSPEVRFQQFNYWLNFIRARMTPTEPVGFAGNQLWATRAVLVATHADASSCTKTSKGDWMLNDEELVLGQLQKTFDADIIVVPHVFALDANQAMSTEMKQLRNTLGEMKKFLCQYMPNSLGILSSTIAILPEWCRVLADFPIVGWTSFVEFIRSKINLLATNDHLKELVVQLQTLGEILCLGPDPATPLIVLSPKWLGTDVIGRLFSFEFISQTARNGRLSVDHLRSAFPKSDLGDMVILLEALGVCVKHIVSLEMELEVPSLYLLKDGAEVTAWDAAGPYATVMGGVRISSPSNFGDQASWVFPRIQVNVGARLLYRDANDNYEIQQCRGSTVIRSGSMVGLILMLNDGHIDIRCRGTADQRSALFFFQEEICDVVFTSLDTCCPGLYLHRGPLSTVQLRDQRPLPHAYSPRDIFIAQLERRSTVWNTEDDVEEQLADLFTYGDQEVFAGMAPGVDLHVSYLSLYSRFRLAALLDPKDDLGRDWCMLATKLGLQDQIPRMDVKDPSALSKLDGILAIWSHSQYATVRALHGKLAELERTDAIEELESLASLFRYTAPLQDGGQQPTGSTPTTPASETAKQVSSTSPR